MADRYTGRHIRQARHGAWVNKKRSRQRSSRQLLPAATALTVAGLLVGGTGAAMQLASSGAGALDRADAYLPPPDRTARLDPTAQLDPTGGTDEAGSQTEAQPFAILGDGLDATPPGLAGPAAARVISTGSCDASYYAEGQATASGETFDPDALTAAHKSLPFNTRVRVTNTATGESVTVRINDRGPFVKGRCLDLSRAAFDEIANLNTGVIDVRYEVLAEDAT